MPSSNKTQEQHMAVFGASGSGKTVLLSSFYGASQEAKFEADSLYEVIGDDAGQALKLHKNYLKMKESAVRPPANRIKSITYAFSIRAKKWEQRKKSAVPAPFNALRLVWHDYPGEWFEESPQTPTEQQNRIDAFKALLSADVALVLIDAEQLVANRGAEERYLKVFLNSVTSEIKKLTPDLLGNGKRLLQLPRIWVFALSKSDQLPDLDVRAFRDLLVVKAADEIGELRDVLATLAQAPEALSVGEDYVLLSSAKFEPEKIDLTERVGVDLLLPMASMLPFERHIKWAKRGYDRGKVLQTLLKKSEPLIGLLAWAVGLIGTLKRLPGPLGLLATFIASLLTEDVMQKLVNTSEQKIRDANTAALARHDYLTAMLTGFQLDLQQAERDGILIRSKI